MDVEVEYEVDEGLLSVTGIDFFGACDVSENRQFILGWSEAHIGQPGNIILIEKGGRIIGVKVLRPMGGKVSNAGIFVIDNDPGGRGLKSDILIYSPAGKLIISYRIKANICNMGISPSGRYVVWQTAHNPDSENGNKLFFFDLVQKRVSWARTPEPGWADDYEFDDEKRILRLICRAGRSYRYNYEGEFLDANELEKNLLTSDLSYEVLRAVEDKLKSGTITTGDYPKLINYLEAALRRGPDDDTKSSIWRRIGEMRYELGELSLAKERLEEALKLNPKVGAKRLLAKINKELK